MIDWIKQNSLAILLILMALLLLWIAWPMISSPG